MRPNGMSAQAAKPEKDVIYVDVEDEITSIIDKIESASNKVVALVLPKRAASMQSIVNMKLLKRSADTAAKNVVLITSEHALLPLAGAAGLHVAKNLQSKPEIPQAPAGAAVDTRADETADMPSALDEEDLPRKIDYDRPVGALAASHEAENPETIDLDDDEDDSNKAAAPAAAAKTPREKVKVPNFDRFRMLLGLGALGLIALIVFIILAIFVLPKATITIDTASEPVSATFNLTASSGAQSIDAQNGIIPAKLETTDQTGSQQVTATGQQNNGQKATGTITASTTCTSPPDTVPAGTAATSNGLTFITTKDLNLDHISINGGHFVCSGDVPITASQGGSKYNLASGSSFSIASYSASNSDPISGGTDNIVTVLSQGDVDGAKQKLTSGTSSDQFAKDFEKKLSDQGEYVLTSTLKVGDVSVTASPSVGQPASTANVSLKITYTVLTVKKDDLSQIIEAKTNSQIDKSKQKLSGNFLNDANVTVQSQSSPSNAVLAVNEDTTAVPIINVASVKKQSEGKKVGDIKSTLNNWPGVKSVDVKLSPFWVSKVPKKDSKVTVKLVEERTKPAGNSAP